MGEAAERKSEGWGCVASGVGIDGVEVHCIDLSGRLADDSTIASSASRVRSAATTLQVCADVASLRPVSAVCSRTVMETSYLSPGPLMLAGGLQFP